jgi:hypothetical protein
MLLPAMADTPEFGTIIQTPKIVRLPPPEEQLIATGVKVPIHRHKQLKENFEKRFIKM